MKKITSVLVILMLLVGLVIIPAQAADKVVNLIDESGATWAKTDVGTNTVTTDFSGGKLVATAPGAWPYITSTLNEPLVLKASDNATINLKFTVEDATGTASVRLGCGEDQIFLHHFVTTATYDTAGDAVAGTYELSAKIFDLKEYAGSATDAYLGKKDLVLDADGNLTIDGIQIWCSGASTAIKVTFEKFEIVIPGDGGSTTSEPAKVSKNVAAGKTYTLKGVYTDTTTNQVSYPDTTPGKLTDGLFATEASYGDAAFIGLNMTSTEFTDDDKTAQIVLDLGEKMDLTKFTIETMSLTEAGITAPSEIKVAVSDDGTTWTDAGTMTYADADQTAVAIYKASLEKAASGKFVKLSMTFASNWIFVSEVEAYALVDDGGDTDVSTPATGDSINGIYGFAVIALVSIAGAAVVIKKRA